MGNCILLTCSEECVFWKGEKGIQVTAFKGLPGKVSELHRKGLEGLKAVVQNQVRFKSVPGKVF